MILVCNNISQLLRKYDMHKNIFPTQNDKEASFLWVCVQRPQCRPQSSTGMQVLQATQELLGRMMYATTVEFIYLL
jgi:hypothetical protein